MTARFEELVARHEGEVVRLCSSLLRDEHLGADAAQEAFVKLWSRLAGGGELVSAGGWLRRVAVSTALDLRRRRGVRDAAARATEAADEDPRTPDAQLANRELRAAFETAVGRLPDGQRTIFLLRHEAGLSLVEVAAALGVGRETVKTQFARACLHLQRDLRRHAPDREER